MIKVLQVLSSLKSGGGVQTMLKNYYSHMDPMAFATDFVVCGEDIGGMESWFESRGSRIYHIPPRTRKPLENVHALKNIIVTGHYDVLHCHQDYHGAVAVAMAKHFGVPTRIIHSHQAYPPESAVKSMRRLIESQIVMRDATVLAACGTLAGTWLYGREAVDSGQVTILHNAIDVDAFGFSAAARKQLRDELCIAENTTVIGHIGRFTKQKNHALLINIFAEFHRREPNSVLLLAGDGPMLQATKRQTAQIGIENAVFFLGVRSDVPRLLSGMDVFLLPSLWEGLGIAAVEAQVNGLPCICSHMVPEEVRLSEQLCFMPKTSYSDLSAWCCMLERLSTVGRADGRAAARAAGYDISCEARKLEELYLNGYN